MRVTGKLILICPLARTHLKRNVFQFFCSPVAHIFKIIVDKIGEFDVFSKIIILWCITIIPIFMLSLCLSIYPWAEVNVMLCNYLFMLYNKLDGGGGVSNIWIVCNFSRRIDWRY